MEYTSEQIHVMLLEKITGAIDPADNLIVEQLLAEDEDLRQQWLNLNEVVEQAAATGFSVMKSEEQSWQEIKPLLRKRSTPRLVVLKALSAAAVAAAVFAGIYLFNGQRKPVKESRSASGVTIALENGTIIPIQKGVSKKVSLDGTTMQIDERGLTDQSSASGSVRWRTVSVPAVLTYKVWLADGSEVWLNATTKLRFPCGFPGSTREVYVEGEAYFKVAKNRLRPFVVHTPQTDVLVTGTQFNVNTYNPDNIQTALVEGSVTTKGAGDRQVALRPGYKASYNVQNGFRTETFDDADVLSWMKGVYYFHNTPLQELSGVLARWYGIKVHFDNVALQTKTFSGALTKKQPLQLFLENLRLSADVNSSIKDSVLYLW